MENNTKRLVYSKPESWLDTKPKTYGYSKSKPIPKNSWIKTIFFKILVLKGGFIQEIGKRDYIKIRIEELTTVDSNGYQNMKLSIIQI
jgi:hypothetical protein